MPTSTASTYSDRTVAATRSHNARVGAPRRHEDQAGVQRQPEHTRTHGHEVVDRCPAHLLGLIVTHTEVARANGASTGVAQTGGRHAPCQARGRALCPAQPVGVREQPHDRRPRAAHQRDRPLRPRAPLRAQRRSAGTARPPPRCRSFSSSSLAAGTGALSSSAALSAPRRSSSSAAGAAHAQPVRLRVHRRRGKLRAAGRISRPNHSGLGSGSRSRTLASARRQPAPRRDLRGHVCAQLRSQLAQQLALSPDLRRAWPAAAPPPRRPSRLPAQRRPGSACRSSAAAAPPPSRWPRGTLAAPPPPGSAPAARTLPGTAPHPPPRPPAPTPASARPPARSTA